MRRAVLLLVGLAAVDGFFMMPRAGGGSKLTTTITSRPTPFVTQQQQQQHCPMHTSGAAGPLMMSASAEAPAKKEETFEFQAEVAR